MDLVEIAETPRMSREDAAVPDEVDFTLEVEIEDDKGELEVELTW